VGGYCAGTIEMPMSPGSGWVLSKYHRDRPMVPGHGNYTIDLKSTAIIMQDSTMLHELVAPIKS